MFFILSKTLYYLLMPLTWLIASLLFALKSRNVRHQKKALWLAVAWIFIFGNQFLANQLLLYWEVPPVAMHDVAKHDVGIVLTGVLNNYQQPADRTYFQKGADRITHALQLYKEGKITKILISGGVYEAEARNEAEALRDFLMLAGVPAADILLEDQSLNTRENALKSAEILKQKFPEAGYLLITSAFHMRRAQGCFRQAGVATTAFATDFYSREASWSPFFWLLPSEKGFYHWYILCHELLGYAVYSLLGYA